VDGRKAEGGDQVGAAGEGPSGGQAANDDYGHPKENDRLSMCQRELGPTAHDCDPFRHHTGNYRDGDCDRRFCVSSRPRRRCHRWPGRLVTALTDEVRGM
jgi:hypothetical protein